MLKRPSEQRLTLEERVAVVIATAVSVGLHVAILAAGGEIGRLLREEKRPERRMVVRQVREIAPGVDRRVTLPETRRVRLPVGPAPEVAAPSAPQKAAERVSPRGTLPPAPKAETPPKDEEQLQTPVPGPEEAEPAEEQGAGIGDGSVSVVTDLPAASFMLSGPAEYRGAGTFWIRRGAKAGTYRVAFNPVDGFGTPPAQTKELAEKGQIVFVGKYRRTTEVVVESNEPAARFTIFRPDGRPLDMSRPGREFFENLPAGNYTVVFNDVPGRTAPAASVRALVAGGGLHFFGVYTSPPGARVPAAAPARSAETSVVSGERARKASPAPPPHGAVLDRRVQLVVKSYPETDIEESHPPIAYPEIVIRKSIFQQGWCQVYLVVSVDDSGQVGKILVERPKPEERGPYEALLSTVEESVRGWDYDKVSAEVHVDVRFYVE